MTAAPDAVPATAPRRAPVFDSHTVRFWSRALIASYPLLLAMLWLRGLVPLDDFGTFWAAGRLALAGHASSAYDWVAIKELRPFATGVTAFFYPPFFLLVLAPLAALPFAAAGAVWLAANLGVYLEGVRRILPGRTAALAALAAPMVVFNLTTGQNGLLTTGLLGAAIVLLDTSPLASGISIGLLSYKPHFGILLPFFLAVTGRWRVFGVAALTIAGLSAAAGLCFGWGIFGSFAAAIPVAHDAYLRHAHMTNALSWSMMASLYATLRALGVGAVWAWSAHVALAVVIAAATLFVSLGRASDDVKSASLSLAAFAIAPYSERDDLAILLLPLAFLVRDGLANGFWSWERPGLAAVFGLPLIYPVLWGAIGVFGPVPATSLVGLGPLMCLCLVALIGCRVVKSQGGNL